MSKSHMTAALTENSYIRWHISTATTVVIRNCSYITLGWADQFRIITELQCINARPPSGGRDWTPASLTF